MQRVLWQYKSRYLGLSTVIVLVLQDDKLIQDSFKSLFSSVTLPMSLDYERGAHNGGFIHFPRYAEVESTG
jgi:hypothetical protein